MCFPSPRPDVSGSLRVAYDALAPYFKLRSWDLGAGVAIGQRQKFKEWAGRFLARLILDDFSHICRMVWTCLPEISLVSVLQVNLCSSLPQIRRMPRGLPLPSLPVGTRAPRRWIKASWILSCWTLLIGGGWAWLGDVDLFLGSENPHVGVILASQLATGPLRPAWALGFWGWWRAQSIETCFYTEDSTGTWFQQSTVDILWQYHANMHELSIYSVLLIVDISLPWSAPEFSTMVPAQHEAGMGQVNSTWTG